MRIIDPGATAAALRGPAPQAQDPKTTKAVSEFDAYFLAQILKSAQPEGEEHMLDGGSAGRMYREQFFDEMAKFVAQQGSFGMSNQIKELNSNDAGVDAAADKEVPT